MRILKKIFKKWNYIIELRKGFWLVNFHGSNEDRIAGTYKKEEARMFEKRRDAKKALNVCIYEYGFMGAKIIKIRKEER